MNNAEGFIVLVSPFTVFITLRTIYNWIIYLIIKKTGEVSPGLIFSCKKTKHRLRLIFVYVTYDPIIVFPHSGKRYKLRPMGIFYSSPGDVGDKVEVIFSERYPKKVVMVRKYRWFESYLVQVLALIAMCGWTLRLILQNML